MSNSNSFRLTSVRAESFCVRGDGFDQIRGFSLDKAEFVLADGLQFAELSFVQVQGHTGIRANGSALAQVEWVKASQLASVENFVRVGN